MLSYELLAALLANEHFDSRLTTFLEVAEAVIELQFSIKNDFALWTDFTSEMIEIKSCENVEIDFNQTTTDFAV